MLFLLLYKTKYLLYNINLTDDDLLERWIVCNALVRLCHVIVEDDDYVMCNFFTLKIVNYTGTWETEFVSMSIFLDNVSVLFVQIIHKCFI